MLFFENFNVYDSLHPTWSSPKQKIKNKYIETSIILKLMIID